jgi:hypothetical protein
VYQSVRLTGVLIPAPLSIAFAFAWFGEAP